MSAVPSVAASASVAVAAPASVAVVEPESYWRAHGGDALLASLSGEERVQAGRFLFEPDRIGYAVAHHLLRTMLAAELGTTAAGLTFCRAAGGRPELGAPGAPLSFNLSHTRGMVACALSRHATVGIDVEWDRSLGDLEPLARSVLTPAELARLHELPPQRRSRALLGVWTAKEAYVKATGQGLSRALTSIEVDPGPEPAIRAARTGLPLAGVQLRRLEAGPGHLGALVLITDHGRPEVRAA